MAAAAASMLHYKPTNIDENDDDDDNDDVPSPHDSHHPYAMDMFANEVDANDRYESVTIPDVHGHCDATVTKSTTTTTTTTRFFVVHRWSLWY
jgi:hypothetical protein